MSDLTNRAEPASEPVPERESVGATGTVAGTPRAPSEPVADTSEGETGTVVGGFGPLEDPPRLEGVPMIGDPDKPESSDEAGDGGRGGEASDGDSDPAEHPAEIDPALLAIDSDLAARAGTIAEETVRIGQQVTQFEQSQAFGEADELKLVEEESP